MKSKIDSYEECIPYFNMFVTKQNNSEEQEKQHDLKNDFYFGRKKFYYDEHENCILKTSKLPQRIDALYQKGTFKIALERKQDNSMSRRESLLERKVGKNANERQLALYKQGVAKIRQQIMSSPKYQHKNDPTDPTKIRTKTGISKKEIKRRQLSLYELGVKKQRERRNRQELTELNGQKQEVLGQPKGDNNNYYKGLHRLLHNLVSKMDHPIPFSETSSAEIKDSSFSSRHETALNVVSNGIAGAISTLALDLPEIYDLQKSPTTSLTTLRKKKKAVMNISKLCTMSKYILDQSSTKTAINICHDSALHDDVANADMKNALELGLRGIVIQYLQDFVKEDQRRSKMLQKYSYMDFPQGIEIESAVSSSTRNDHVVLDLSSEEEEEPSRDNPMNIFHATSKAIIATESLLGNQQLNTTDQVSSCGGISLHEGSLSSGGRNCLVGCWYGSDGIEMMLLEHDYKDQSL
jgi:hypothetical protein